jgi:hypothetical protein
VAANPYLFANISDGPFSSPASGRTTVYYGIMSNYQWFDCLQSQGSYGLAERAQHWLNDDLLGETYWDVIDYWPATITGNITLPPAAPVGK